MTTQTVAISDRAPLDGAPRLTKDGYLIATAKIARTGIQDYLGREFGKPELRRVRVYRPESEVFSGDALASFAHKPITVDHPSEPIDAKSWRQHAIGFVGGEVARDGDYIRVPLTIMDADAIQTLNGGKRELSCGYLCTIDWTPGKTPDGQDYDAIQTGIRGNHLALVDQARAGPECRIGDAWNRPVNQQEEEAMTLKVTVDGFTFDASEQAAQAIAKLGEKVTTKDAEITTIKADHSKALAAKDADIAKKDAEIDSLKAKVLSDADLDKRVADRAALIGAAKALAPTVETKGLSDAAIRKAVVKALLGDASVDGKSDAYVDARFDILAEDAAKGSDTFRKAVEAGGDQRRQTGDARADAYVAMLSDMQTAHVKKEA